MADVDAGQSPPSPEVVPFDGEGMPFLQGNAEFGSQYPTAVHRCDSAPRIADAGALLVSVRAPVGAVNIADQRYGIGRGLAAVRPRAIHARYAYWLLLSSAGWLNSIATGSTFTAISGGDLGDVSVPVTIEREQRAIADYLDRETAQIDAFIVKNEELITLLTEGRRAAIDDAFERLDARPTRLKYCASIQTGVTLGGDGEPTDPEWPYLRVANVQVGRVDLDELKTIRIPESRARRSMLSEGDVLMTEGGDRDKLGRGALWSGEVEPMLHQNHVFAVKVRPTLDARFLMRWLDASPSRRYFETTAVQTTNLASTNKTLVGNLPLPFCSVEAQFKLVVQLDQQLGKLDHAVDTVERCIELARERRAALISAAVTGKIDVGVAA
ncbi:restriction endonuclease subunit S [Microbacterium sp. NE2HP2]|uniref:restriction endonuclease subunit S n=1 Tax=Microbacterium plantarum TaxID=1816425 RepID=UPI002366AFC3|nr:restriction endonuclease subunit S [Microbacterium plantarum]MDD7944723.1 restriction endonuclease subunit S [Microbacterium plantarum]